MRMTLRAVTAAARYCSQRLVYSGSSPRTIDSGFATILALHSRAAGVTGTRGLQTQTGGVNGLLQELHARALAGNVLGILAPASAHVCGPGRSPFRAR